MARPIANSGFAGWTPDRLPDLNGRRYLITGANCGLGFAAAKLLADRNADVVVACRNPDKARAAVDELGTLGSGTVESVTLDLAGMASVRAAADEVRRRWDGFDAIVNNAGIMQTPQRLTDDGYELQFATNHLGHFLLNGLLLNLVAKRDGRIVAVSSMAHKRGRLHLDDLMLTRNYSPIRAYCQSKLANLMYAIELDRRLRAAGSGVASIACHPGYVLTQLQSNASPVWRLAYAFGDLLFGQSVEQGAAPLVLAAAGLEARSGAYYGPTGFADARGPVGDASVAGKALDRNAAARLWQASERLTGFDWTNVLVAKATS